ncbi:redoxin domain-containing protein [Psychrosphaera haliotis]|uniref:redoxin domain-containing protein n=1 Tax=Psychrosphaera haliotis TaxID=555083 RepID=UPI00237255E8|nr:redoxin domain-containing protein [Psychrosphaera haliotis]
MFTNKLHPGTSFPHVEVNLSKTETFTLGSNINNDADWQLIIVYRGAHCPLCTKFLNELEEVKYLFLDIGIEIVAISADRLEQLDQHKKDLKVNFTLGYGLSLADMDQLGVYQSTPRNDHETDHVFSEPAMFVINREKTIIAVDLSNNPFSRPDVLNLLNGLKWVRNPDNDYPIRGAHHEPV